MHVWKAGLDLRASLAMHCCSEVFYFLLGFSTESSMQDFLATVIAANGGKAADSLLWAAEPGGNTGQGEREECPDGDAPQPEQSAEGMG